MGGPGLVRARRAGADSDGIASPEGGTSESRRREAGGGGQESVEPARSWANRHREVPGGDMHPAPHGAGSPGFSGNSGTGRRSGVDRSTPTNTASASVT